MFFDMFDTVTLPKTYWSSGNCHRRHLSEGIETQGEVRKEEYQKSDNLFFKKISTTSM